MSTALSVAQLNKIHARIHELISNAPVHDEEVLSFPVHGQLNPGGTIAPFDSEEQKTIILGRTSEIKTFVYKEFCDALGYNQIDSHQVAEGNFPLHQRKPQPETLLELTEILSQNPFTKIIRQLGGMLGNIPAIVDVNSYEYSLKIQEVLWQQIATQVKEELPQLLAETRSFTERTGR